MTERQLNHVIAYLIAAISAIAASLYGFMSAAGWFGIAKGAGLFFVAFIGCHGPAWCVKLKRELGWAAAIFAGVVTATCFAVTLWGGLGTIASGTAELHASRDKVSTDVSRDRTDLDRLTAQRLAMLFTPVSEAGVQAARDAVDAAQRSKDAECDNGRGRHCRDREADLKAAQGTLTTALGNRASTEAAEKLDTETSKLRARIDKVPAVVVIDPQASAFSQLTGIPVDTSAAIYAFSFAVALELAAMLAMLVAKSSLAPVKPAAPALVPSADTASVVQFMMQHLPRSEGSRVEARAVYSRFLIWCSDQKLRPLAPDVFADAFRTLCERGRINVRYEDKKAICEGVRLN